MYKFCTLKNSGFECETQQQQSKDLCKGPSGNNAGSEPAISPTAAAAQEAIHQLFVTSKRDGANFLRSTLPALTVKLSKMMQETSPTSELQPQSILSGHSKHSSKPPLSDKDFRSFLDNVGELIRPRELRIVIYKGKFVY